MKIVRIPDISLWKFILIILIVKSKHENLVKLIYLYLRSKNDLQVCTKVCEGAVNFAPTLWVHYTLWYSLESPCRHCVASLIPFHIFFFIVWGKLQLAEKPRRRTGNNVITPFLAIKSSQKSIFAPFLFHLYAPCYI